MKGYYGILSVNDYILAYHAMVYERGMVHTLIRNRHHIEVPEKLRINGIELHPSFPILS